MGAIRAALRRWVDSALERERPEAQGRPVARFFEEGHGDYFGLPPWKIDELWWIVRDAAEGGARGPLAIPVAAPLEDALSLAELIKQSSETPDLLFFNFEIRPAGFGFEIHATRRERQCSAG